MKRIQQYLLVFFLLMLLLLVACGGQNQEESQTTEEDSATEETKETEETNEPIVVEGQNGDVTIPANLDKIIAPYMEDSLLALGVTPAAQWAIGESVQTYLQDQLEGVETIEWDMPLEQVLSYQPDLLILSTVDSMTGQLTDYEEIAPTYVFKPEDHNDIRQQIKIIGEIVGKSDEAEARLNEYDSKVTEAKEQLVNTVGDETVAIIWVAGDQYFMFEQDRHAAKVLYEELGLTPSALTVELGAAEANWNPISLEKLAELEADHLFLLAEEGVTGVDALENSSVYQNLKAVQNDHVYHYTDPSNWTNKGIIAYEKTIEDVTEAFNN